ncbi:AP-4 complex subunit sigma isoform X1 [Lycium barbarum]|uniref:AP-4 complex subunit sigma isoform X1 n=1 Tax=Lycium barbarum TaxID=112863 RepID=UPI00293E5A5F|nr:AP-4 complex subunit sigma isoform X1 [Lycium barbarum]
MGIRFILMVNKQGQTRLAQYYEYLTIDERRALEGEIVRKCLARNEQQCSFVEHRNYKIVYRRYASLFFLVGVDNEEASGTRGGIVMMWDSRIWNGKLHVQECTLTSYFMAMTQDFRWHLSGVYGPNSKKEGQDMWEETYAARGFYGDLCVNELAILEFIHLLVETMDRHFGNVCELDIMFHLEKAHFMLEEMVMNGCIVETSKANILTPIQLMDKAS